MSEKISQLPPFSGGSLPSTAKIPVSIDEVTYKASPSQFGGGGGAVGNLQEVTDNGNETTNTIVVNNEDNTGIEVIASGSGSGIQVETIGGLTCSLYNENGHILNMSASSSMLGNYIYATQGGLGVVFKVDYEGKTTSKAFITQGGTTAQLIDGTGALQDIPTYVEDIRDTVKATQSINKGQAVYISGANGTNQLATKADYSAEISSSQTIGIAFQNFATNDIGQIITQGILSGIDTSSASNAGDPIYLGANGNLIYGYANKPSAPNHLVYIGIVTRKHATNGEIYVKVQNGYEVEELHNMQDVSYSTPNDADSLMIKDNSTSLWKRLTFANLKTWLDNYLTASKIRGYLGITTLSGSNTGDQDLSGLALKQMSAYSMRVNNTNATANATEIPFQQIGKSAYTGTITWTGTTAPSGTTNHSYNWQRVGNLATLNVTLVYGTAGTLITQAVIPFMSDFPTPIKPDGLTGASNILYTGTGRMASSETGFATSGADVYIRSNSSNNGFEIVINSTGISTKVVRFSIQYFTA